MRPIYVGKLTKEQTKTLKGGHRLTVKAEGEAMPNSVKKYPRAERQTDWATIAL